MARVTVEDCLARVPNRFALTILGSRRARALSEGRGHALVECENKEGVTALREISASKVRFREEVEPTMMEFIEEQRRQLRVTTGEHTFLEAASLRALEEDDEADEVDEPDVEELPSDPEALNKAAKSSAAATDDDADGDGDSETPAATEEESESSDDEAEAPAEDLEPGAFGDDDVPEEADGEEGGEDEEAKSDDKADDKADA